MPEQSGRISGLADSAEGSPRPATNHRRWVLLACAIVAVGLAASLSAALLWRSSVRADARQEFQSQATDVNARLETLLNRDTDFVETLRALLTMQPHLSATRFDQWFAELQGTVRQVGGLGTTVVERVPVAELAAFQARRDANPAFRALVGGRLEPVARSGRADYCLLSAGGTVMPLSQAVGKLLQGDWCDPSSPIGGYPAGQTSQAVLMPSITDSGQFVVYPVTAQSMSTLFIEAAFYRRGASLATIAERRAAVAGWVGSSFDIRALIREAIAGHGDLSVALYHSNPGRPEELIAQAGSGGALAHDTTMQIDGIWRAVVRGSVVTGGLPANVQGLLVLVGGSIISILLSALMLVLAGSRERALAMAGQLRHQTLHDPLTGLPNRVLALDRTQQMLARARRQQIPVAALYVDLDGFKNVNDTFGHAVGDGLLRIVAARLMTVVREGDTAARLAGAECLGPRAGSTLDAGPELVAERLLEVLRQPYDVSHTHRRQVAITASVGIAVGARASAEELLNDADLALYEAKANGHDRYAMFESSMQTTSRDRLTLQMDLAEALEQHQFFLLYQPTFDLRSESVTGVEALIRWRHPTRGVVSPVEFIPIAEGSGLIVPIGRWVFNEACRQASIWHRHGHKIGIAVNVSARQLDHDELIEEVRDALQASDLDPAALTLEVTETALMRDADATATRLHQLKALGVRIAVDDFGTGYSSLAYLRQFPADVLKIDRSFIAGIATSKESAALIHTLVRLGKTLDMQTLAEGIEDQAQLEVLRRERCDQGQGFLFSRPLEADTVEQFLNAARSTTQPLVIS